MHDLTKRFLESLKTDLKTEQWYLDNVIKLNLQYRNKKNQTLLHLLAMDASPDVFSAFLESCQKYHEKFKNFLNIQDTSSRTGLHYAALSGSQEKIDALMECKPSDNSRDGKGFRPVDYARLKGCKIKRPFSTFSMDIETTSIVARSSLNRGYSTF